MPAFKPQQRHLTINDREFHFVAYEGSPTNLRQGQEPYPAMWCLMVEGRRCPVVPFDETQSEEQVNAALCAWAEEHAIDRNAAPAAVHGGTSAEVLAKRDRDNWWGPN